MSTPRNTSFIYTGGTRMTRPLPPLPSNAFIDVSATDATRPTLANEDFDALYGSNITPERFVQPLDEVNLCFYASKVHQWVGIVYSTGYPTTEAGPLGCPTQMARRVWLHIRASHVATRRGDRRGAAGFRVCRVGFG